MSKSHRQCAIKIVLYDFLSAIAIRDNTYGGRVCDMDEPKYDDSSTAVIVGRLCNDNQYKIFFQYRCFTR